ncbi:MAG: hypothetical protein EOR84_22830 [Mesorhizobium sp.]|uniref:hypothetical protein n=1 Tax=Mesorhizobium sp. TaxID=1871066 RepID=UPI000FE9808E|nr:hypothetical protein [Mesorhizobium sp.]RWM90047.1 MAG: hypothetical protein EOR84_22830 [Mesorhizobium sp.]
MDDGVSLRDYQIADLAYYIRNPKWLNLSDPGTGKTPSVCVYQWWLWREHGVGSAFVMPLSLLKKNRDEILRFTDFEPDEVTIVTGLKPLSPSQQKLAKTLLEWDHSRREYELFGSQKVTFKALLDAGVCRPDMTVDKRMLVARTKLPYELANPGNTKVFLMGFDAFSTHWSALPKFVKAVQVDEIHKGYKGDSSQRTQGFYASFFSGPMEYFGGMTGTLVSGRLDSAYPAIRVIEPRYYPSYKGFYYFHSIEDPITGKLKAWRNHEKLSAIFGKHGIRRTFEMVYGKEAKVIIPEWVEMSEKQREIYNKFKDEAFLELEKFYLDGTQPGVGFIRARQIMEHPNSFPDLSKDDGSTIDIMKGARCGKEERLDIHFEDHARTGKPLIIYAALKPQQYRILEMARAYGLKADILNGDVSPTKRGEIDLAFREGRLNCIIASPAVADVGFNWQFCGDQEVDHMIFASLDFLDTTVLQAYRRAIRGKRGKPLRITVLLYEDSLDNRITFIIYQKSLDAHKVDPTQPVLKLYEHNIEGEQEMAEAA